jgi:hypothetical protein
MKTIFLIYFLALIGACSSKIYNSSIVSSKTFESNRGPLFGGNRFIFNPDSSFVYIAHGPSIFLSKGNWQYDKTAREIVLRSFNPDNRFINPKTIDTFWVDISNKKVKVVSNKKLLFENTTYYLKQE